MAVARHRHGERWMPVTADFDKIAELRKKRIKARRAVAAAARGNTFAR
jgi:hypothetical protein